MAGLALVVATFQELWRYVIVSPQSRTRQLEALRQLDDHLLTDIGITREEAQYGHARR